MPDRTSDIRYVCSRQQLKTFLAETCTAVMETLGYPVNEPEEQVMLRVITSAVDIVEEGHEQWGVLRISHHGSML